MNAARAGSAEWGQSRKALALTATLWVVSCGSGSGVGNNQGAHGDTAGDESRSQATLPEGHVRLTPGFAPDPMRLEGAAGGPRTWEADHPGCVGHTPQEPNHTLQVEGEIEFVRFLVHTTVDVDTTMVIERPDGTVSCMDDTFDLNPAIDMAVGPGTYRIWVGVFDTTETRGAPYVLAVTTDRELVTL